LERSRKAESGKALLIPAATAARTTQYRANKISAKGTNETTTPSRFSMDEHYWAARAVTLTPQ
jgi:hypothetical protein